MKKFLLIALSTLALIATELPQSIETTVQSIEDNTVTLANNIPKGMSGIVVHNYGNKLSAITHRLISQGNGKAKIKSYSALEHENLPSIKSPVQKEDKVFFGNFYNNILLLAPNEQTYSQISKNIQKNWIHPDLYAIYLISKEETSLSLSNLRGFAQEHQIGLVLIATEKTLKVLDPISKHYLSETPLKISNTETLSPFYARFEQISNNFFGAESKREFQEYFSGVHGLK